MALDSRDLECFINVDIMPSLKSCDDEEDFSSISVGVTLTVRLSELEELGPPSSEYGGGADCRSVGANDTACGVEHVEDPGDVDNVECGNEGSRDIDKVGIVSFCSINSSEGRRKE